MKTKTIRQSVTFKASPHDVYELLMDPKKHAKFTGGKAVISNQVGGRFNVFDGYAEGGNLDLVHDARIVQTWRASDWPEGHYSTVSFQFEAAKSGTHLTFTQTGVPEEQYEDVAQGWRDYYWTPMKAMLAEEKG